MDEIDQLFKNSCPTSEIEDYIHSHGLDPVSARNSKNQSLLHISAGYGRNDLVKFLIYSGADVSAQDINGQVPLHNAACHGHYMASTKLIRAHADVNQIDYKGWSPLHFAVSRNYNLEKISPIYRKVIELLINSGADPLLRATSGRRRSPLDKVKDLNDRREILELHLLYKLNECEDFDEITRQAIVNASFTIDEYFELVREGDKNFDQLKLLTTPKLMGSQLGSFGNMYPIHRAAGYNQLETAKFFIEEGVDVNLTDDFGRTPLHNAAKHGHDEMIKLLVGHGSEVNKQDHDGLSPLHVAASNQTHRTCLLLIKLGAVKTVKSKCGQLPFNFAESDDVRETLCIPQDPQVVPSTSEQAIYMQIKPVIDRTNQYSTLHDTLLLDSGSDSRLFANTNHEIKKVILDRNDPTFMEIRRRMHNTIVIHNSDSGGHFSSYEILSIEKLLHEEVWRRYRYECQKLEEDYGSKNERLLFHGTNFIDIIQCSGFDERYAKRDGMFGAGIYFAEHSSKSNQYSLGWNQGCQVHNDKSCYLCERRMVYAQVALGRSLRAKEAIPDLSHAPPGYTSISGSPRWTNDLLYPEYAIYNRYHAYPLYLISYKIKP